MKTYRIVIDGTPNRATAQGADEQDALTKFCTDYPWTWPIWGVGRLKAVEITD